MKRPKESKFDLGPIGISVGIAVPVVMAALFYVWTNVTMVRLGYELSEAAKGHKRLLEQNRGLRVEVAALKAPDRLQRLAKLHYALEPPRPEQVVEVE